MKDALLSGMGKGMNALRHFAKAYGFVAEVYLEDEKLNLETIDTSVIFDK